MNIPLIEHELIGKKMVFRPDEPVYHKSNSDYGSLVIGNGMEYEIVHVFENWNDVEGLSVCYCFVPETMTYTHLSFGEMGIGQRVI